MSEVSANESPAGEGSPADSQNPWLVYRHGRNQKFCRVSPSGPLGSESRSLPELQENDVLHCSPDGRWLLLRGRKRVLLWNPGRRKSIELPRLDHFSGAKAVFSCSPDDPNCVIYMFRSWNRKLLFCRVGDEEWSCFKYPESIRAQIRRCDRRTHNHYCCLIYQPVSLQGKVYALLTCFQELVEISVDEFNLCSCTVLTRNPQLPLLDACKLYLVPWEDHRLYLIKRVAACSHDLVFRESHDIRVMEFDFGTSCWHCVPSLDGGAIFLGMHYNLAYSAKQKWSFVYYTSDHNQMLFSHRVEDGRITSYAPCPTYLTPGQEVLWLPRWIKPCDLDASEQADDNGSNITMRHCSEKRKVLENVAPLDGDCSKKSKVDENGSARLCDLLPELMEKVAEKVSSFVEYTYFLNINKLGIDVAARTGNKFRPCLIYRDKMETVYHIIEANISQAVHVEIPRQAVGKRIGCCRYGWLLVEDGSLFNPLTRQVIETVGCKYRNGGSGISNLTFVGGKPSPLFPDKSSVLAMALLNPWQGSSLEPGDAAEVGKAVWWKLEVEKFQASCNSPVLLGEDWYYLGYGKSTGRLGCLRLSNLEEGAFEWRVEELGDPCQDYARNFLVECGGQLLSVFIGDEQELWVRVFKIRRKWEEMDTLGGYCLYLGLAASISCVAETVDKADRIYFPKLYKDGLVYYSLRTKQYHSIGNEQEEVKRHHPITMLSDCAWIIPDSSY